MHLHGGNPPGQPRWRSAFTLPEVLISVGIVSVMFVSLYAGISQGLAIITAAREHLRATQIMLEKMEAMRLYSWDQIMTTGYVPSAFTERFAPTAATNATAVGTNSASGSGVTYYGSISFGAAPVDDAYTNSMRLVTISLNWTNSNIARQLSMQSLVAEHGIQEFTY